MKKHKPHFRCRILYRPSLVNPEEWDMESAATRFALEMMMPKDAFLNAVREHNGSIRAIAESFGVPWLAVRARAFTLGIKGHGL